MKYFVLVCVLIVVRTSISFPSFCPQSSSSNSLFGFPPPHVCVCVFFFLRYRFVSMTFLRSPFFPFVSRCCV